MFNATLLHKFSVRNVIYEEFIVEIHKTPQMFCLNLIEFCKCVVQQPHFDTITHMFNEFVRIFYGSMGIKEDLYLVGFG